MQKKTINESEALTMVEDNPRMIELEEMVSFCNRYKYTYIYDHQMPSMLLSKYFFMSQIKIDGFIMPIVRDCDRYNEPFPILTLSELGGHSSHAKRQTGILLLCNDEERNQIIALLKMIGYSNFYILSNWNIRTIQKKMMPRSINDFYLEVNLADHCNLNCQCCDHFSPIASKTFLDYDQYVKDLRRLAYLTDGKIGLMKLQGGEPLLNERLIDFMKVTREFFPDSHICLFTDGVLLPKWGNYQDERNIWKAVLKYEIEIRMTQYPISLVTEKIVTAAESFGVPVTFDPPEFKKGARLWIFSEIGALGYKGIKHSVKHPFDLNGNQEKYRWISCYQFNESIVLRDGKIYTCPMIPYAHYFNEYFDENLEVKEDAYIDIYQVQSFQEIAEFCTHRTSFCDYCAVHKRSSRPWKQSQHSVEEWSL